MSSARTLGAIAQMVSAMQQTTVLMAHLASSTGLMLRSGDDSRAGAGEGACRRSRSRDDLARDGRCASAPAGLAASGLAVSGLAVSGLAVSGLAVSGLAVSGSGFAVTGSG